MKNFNVDDYLRVSIDSVVISEVTYKLYDYSNREAEIEALAESISEIGQREPIMVLKDGDKYPLVDGVLRLMACIRLKLNEVDVIVSDFVPTNDFSFTDFIIHHQIRKEKTPVEKMNEIREILRIDQEDRNPLRDKEKRVKLVSAMMGGRGWGRNNVFNLENIMSWEKSNGNGLNLAQQVVSNNIPTSRAIEATELIDNNNFDKAKEDESCIVKEFLKGSFEKDRARNLMITFENKNNVLPTTIDLQPIVARNFNIIKGNIEVIDLPIDLQIDTIFTSPPYYKLIKYGDDPNELGWEQTPDEYVKRLSDILMKCFGKLKNSGSMFVNIGETYEDHQCLGVIDRLTCELMSRGVRLVDKLIWNKPGNKPVGNNVRRFSPGYEVILHFSKTRDYYFEKFRVQGDKPLKVSHGCKEKGSNKVGFHIPNKHQYFRNIITPEELTNVLTVQVQKNRTHHVEGEQIHPATFSWDLPFLPLVTTCPPTEGTVVFDPFMGSGSCGVTALQLGFKFVGVELYDKNIVTARRILSEIETELEENELSPIMDESGLINDSEISIAA